jgi:hypothetical protein
MLLGFWEDDGETGSYIEGKPLKLIWETGTNLGSGARM